MTYLRIVIRVPLLYSRTVLFIHSKCNNLQLSTPNSQSTPLPPHLGLTCNLVFPTYYPTIRILGVGPQVKLLGSSYISRSTDPTRLSLLHDLRFSGSIPQKQLQLQNNSMAKATQGKTWH